jgi:putative DNA primase/helicase
MPSGAFNRLADNWRPLFAVAEIAAGDWPQRAATAFTKLTGTEDSDAQGVGAMLLADVRQAFEGKQAEKMFSKMIIKTLCGMSDRPWPEAHKAKPITETWLARRLRAFGISSRDVRIGEQHFKGYELADFQEAFERYLPAGANET